MLNSQSHAIRHITTTFAAVIVAIGLLLAGNITEASAAPAPRSGAAFVSETVKSTNAYRKQVHRPQVKSNKCLNKYAAQWATHIGRQGAMVHRTKSSLRSILKTCKLKAIGENLAKGQTSGSAVVTAWRNSAPHRKNMDNKRYRQFGIASYWDGSRWWTVQLLAGK